MRSLQFLFLIISSFKPYFTKTSTIQELQNWFEYIQASSTKCPLREPKPIPDLVGLSKPILEVTNCGGVNDISNYDFKVLSESEVFL